MITNTEKDILADLRSGNESTFDTLFRTWYAPLVRYALTLTDGEVEAAEDIVQQVFLRFWEQRNQIDIQFSIKAYLYRMVYNQGLSVLRAEKTRLRYTQYQQSVMEHISASAPDEKGTELQRLYEESLQKLPPQCRQVFELSRFEALKYREIADHLGISIKTVEAQMGKALRTLRIELTDYLVSWIGFALPFFLTDLTLYNLCN